MVNLTSYFVEYLRPSHTFVLPAAVDLWYDCSLITLLSDLSNSLEFWSNK